VGSSQSIVTSDADGYAAIIPPNGGGTKPLDVSLSVSAGSGPLLQFQLQILPTLISLNESQSQSPFARSRSSSRLPDFLLKAYLGRSEVSVK
jgi:hypothetical protein